MISNKLSKTLSSLFKTFQTLMLSYALAPKNSYKALLITSQMDGRAHLTPWVSVGAKKRGLILSLTMLRTDIIKITWTLVDLDPNPEERGHWLNNIYPQN